MLTVHISIADSAAMPESKTLLTNVNVFNSRNDEPVKGMNAPVEGKKIKTIAKSILAPGGATVLKVVFRGKENKRV